MSILTCTSKRIFKSDSYRADSNAHLAWAEAEGDNTLKETAGSINVACLKLQVHVDRPERENQGITSGRNLANEPTCL